MGKAHLRNFWIESKIDGRKAKITGGPRAGNGGFDLQVRMRDNASSKMVVGMSGYYKGDNIIGLTINIVDPATGENFTKHIEVNRG